MELRLRIILNMSCTDCRKMRQSVFYLLICPSRKRKGNCFASIIYPLEDSTDKGLYLLQLIYTLSSGRYRANPTSCLTLSIFCRGCQIRNPLEDSTDKRFYSLAEYTPFRLVGIERTRRFALRFRYFGSVGILSR